MNEGDGMKIEDEAKIYTGEKDVTAVNIDTEGVQVDDDTLQMRKRQLDFLNPYLHGDKPIHVIGCGGIGSYLVEVLVSMGFHNVCVYDDDNVEKHNLSCQNFEYSHIGMNKAHAIHDKMATKFYDEGLVIPYNKKVTNQRRLSGIVVFAVDNIETRDKLFRAMMVSRNCDVERVIDGRLGGERYEIMNIPLDDREAVEQYYEKLHSPDESEGLSCTGKNIAYIGYEIAGQMGREVKLSVAQPELTTRYQYFDRTGKSLSMEDNIMIY